MDLIVVLNRCYRFKGFIYEKAKFSEKEKPAIKVRIRARKNSRPYCSGCGKRCPGYDRLPEREYEFIPIWGFAVYFLYARRRVNCKECGVIAERLPWAEGKHQLTKEYMHFLANWAKKMSWKEVAESFRTSWEKVFHSVEYVVKWGLEKRDLSGVTAIGVDEIQWHRGHDYLTLVYQINSESTRLLWVGEERTEKTFLQFFEFFGEERTAALEYVCSDMWKPYLKIIREKAGQALHILDRFHIVAKLNLAIDEIRAGEQRRIFRDGYEPILTHSRWCLLKRPENLTERQEIKLRDLLKYNLRSVRAYLLKEEFQLFWEYTSPTWAGKYLDKWITRVMRSKLEPMKKVAKTIRGHRELILNWFKAKKQFSSGVVEGLNNKVKLTIRKSYGFRTFRCAEIALYHALGKLPEPAGAHEFY